MNKKGYLWLAFAIIINIFIFINSLLTGPVSSLQSGFFTTNVYNFLIKINLNIEKETLSFLIRKAAHFLEFFLLGLAWFMVYKRINKVKYPYLFTLVHGLFVATLDETIQFFTPLRSASLIDVFIDLSGVVMFLLIAFLIETIKRKNSHK